MKKYLKDEFNALVSKKSNVDLTSTTHVIDAISDLVPKIIADGDAAVLGTIGYFVKHKVAGREVDNFLGTGKKKQLGGYAKVFFSPSKGMKAIVKKEGKK